MSTSSSFPLFEYLTIIRSSRGSTGHEAEELNDVLNDYAKDGWWLHTILPTGSSGTGFYIQTLVFERSAYEE
jgi:hypothetical protein